MFPPVAFLQRDDDSLPILRVERFGGEHELQVNSRAHHTDRSLELGIFNAFDTVGARNVWQVILSTTLAMLNIT